MEIQQKSPVEIIQELIAIHTTRKEAYQKIRENEASKELSEELDAASQQSDQYMEELMSELSQFGDGVSSEVVRQNGFEHLYKNTMDDIKTMDASALRATFQKLEDSLKSTYAEINAIDTDLPETLKEIIQKQLTDL